MWHRHSWEAIAAKPVTVIDDWGGKNDCTNLLYRCHCGAIKTKRFPGSWSFDELTGGA